MMADGAEAHTDGILAAGTPASSAKQQQRPLLPGRTAGKTPGQGHKGAKATQGCHSITKFFKPVGEAAEGLAGGEAPTPSESIAQPAGEVASVKYTPIARRQSLGSEPTSQKRKAEEDVGQRGPTGPDPGSTAKRCAGTGPAKGGGRPVRAAATAEVASLLAAISQAQSNPDSRLDARGQQQCQAKQWRITQDVSQQAEVQAELYSASLAQQQEADAAALAQLQEGHAAALAQLVEGCEEEVERIQQAQHAQKAEQHAAREAELLRQNAALQEAVADLQRQLGAAWEQLAAAEGSKAAEQQAAVGRISKLEQQLATAEVELAETRRAAEQQAAELEQRLAAVHGQLEEAQCAARQQHAALERQLGAERQLREAAKGVAGQLRAQGKELEAKVASLQADLARLDEQQGDAACQASMWQQRAEGAAAQVAVLQQQLEAARAGAAEAAAAGAGQELAGQVRQLSDALQALRDRHRVLKKELEMEKCCRSEAAVAARVREERLKRQFNDVSKQLELERRGNAELQRQLGTGAGGGKAKPRASAGNAPTGVACEQGTAALGPGSAMPTRWEAIRAAICNLGDAKSSELDGVVGRAQAVLAAQGLQATEVEILGVRRELDRSAKIVKRGNDWVYCYSQAQS